MKNNLSKNYQEKLKKLSKEYEMEVYDLKSFKDKYIYFLNDVSRIWTEQIEKDFKEDSGSCVLGAGFWVWALFNNKYSVPRAVTILQPNTSFQGCGTWEQSQPKIEALLKDKGIDCGYNCGRMD